MLALAVVVALCFNRPTQLLNATSIDSDSDDDKVVKYQQSVISRVIFYHLIPLIIIKYQNINLDVTDCWYFRTWRSWISPSMPMALSNWVGLLRLKLTTRRGALKLLYRVNFSGYYPYVPPFRLLTASVCPLHFCLLKVVLKRWIINHKSWKRCQKSFSS